MQPRFLVLLFQLVLLLFQLLLLQLLLLLLLQLLLQLQLLLLLQFAAAPILMCCATDSRRGWGEDEQERCYVSLLRV